MVKQPKEKHVVLISIAAMVAWIIYLRFQLPRTYQAQHWRMAWIGFDIGLFVSMVTTLFSHLRGSMKRLPASIVAATFLFIDSWFDIVTSQKGEDRLIAFLLAIFLQIPIGIGLIRYSKRIWTKLINHSVVS